MFDIHLLDISIPQHNFFKSNLSMDVVQIASGLKRSIPEPFERLESIVVTMLFYIPAGRFY